MARWRTPSPLPLDPVFLAGFAPSTPESGRIMSRALAEEIRQLIPERLKLAERWTLLYSLEQDGASLNTLYSRAIENPATRAGYVLVVRDAEGGVFGSYMSEPPQPQGSYFGSGECFLWRATTVQARPAPSIVAPSLAAAFSANLLAHSGRATPVVEDEVADVRFRAYMYSGENDFCMQCEPGFFSMGASAHGSDYGLWLDRALERGVSAGCETYGNETLSDQGAKFDVMGVELWMVG